MAFSTESILVLLEAVNGSECTVVESVELGGGRSIIAISVWNGSATVNELLIGPAGVMPLDVWTNYDLPEMEPWERECALRSSLREYLGSNDDSMAKSS
jgi:hypothetical protein